MNGGVRYACVCIYIAACTIADIPFDDDDDDDDDADDDDDDYYYYYYYCYY